MAVNRTQAGVTLVELLLALSLSALVTLMALSLFRDVGIVARITGGRRDAAFRAQAAFGALAENLMTGRGILRLEPSRAVLLNRRNVPVTYAWEDSALTANGVPFKFALATLRLEPEGPVRPAWRPFGGSLPWDLDSLDDDHDGRLGFDELDHDRDGALDAAECGLIASVRITMVAAYRGIPFTLTALVHPRNRAVDSADGEDGPRGIPEP